MRSRTILPNPWFASMRSPFPCTPMSGRRCRLRLVRSPNAITNTDDAETANVFCAVEPKAGKHFTFPTPNRSPPELARVLDKIIGSYPFARTVHLVMDNLNIHCRKTLTD